MSPYNIENETRTTNGRGPFGRGPFGLAAREKVTTAEIGRISEGQTVKLIDSRGKEVGQATVSKGDKLKIEPQGDVVADFGPNKGFRAVGPDGKWLGAINTNKDCTLRTVDGKHQVHLRRVG